MSIEKICGIYKITNPSGQMYIGKSKDIYKRWIGYKSLTFIYPSALLNSFIKEGVGNHIFEILEVCSNELSTDREKYWISFFDTFNTPHGFNRNKGGGGCVEHTEDTKKIIGQHSKGNKHCLGKKYSQDRLNKMRQYKPTEETKQKIYSKTRGQKRSVEQRKRISDAKKGKPVSQEQRDKIRKTLTGTKHSPETILKRVLANSGEKASMYGKFGKNHPAFGTKRTDEQKEKQKQGLKKSWDKKREAGLAVMPESMKQNLKAYYAKLKSNPEYYSPEEKEKRRRKILKSWETIRKNKLLNENN